MVERKPNARNGEIMNKPNFSQSILPMVNFLVWAIYKDQTLSGLSCPLFPVSWWEEEQMVQVAWLGLLLARVGPYPPPPRPHCPVPPTTGFPQSD
jgi:hypothetical protein